MDADQTKEAGQFEKSQQSEHAKMLIELEQEIVTATPPAERTARTKSSTATHNFTETHLCSRTQLAHARSIQSSALAHWGDDIKKKIGNQLSGKSKFESSAALIKREELDQRNSLGIPGLELASNNIANNYDRIIQNYVTGKTPNPSIQSVPEPEPGEVTLQTDPKKCKVRRDGIRFQGFHYFDPNLSGHVGEYVSITYNPEDLSEIAAYAEDVLICCAPRIGSLDRKDYLPVVADDLSQSSEDFDSGSYDLNPNLQDPVSNPDGLNPSVQALNARPDNPHSTLQDLNAILDTFNPNPQDLDSRPKSGNG